MNLVRPHFEWDDVAVSTGRVDANDFVIAKDVAERLFGMYPDHAWYVGVDHEAGSIIIRNLALSVQSGYLLHLARYAPMGPDGRQAVVRKAGGEILERFGVRRGRYAAGDYDGRIQKARFATGA